MCHACLCHCFGSWRLTCLGWVLWVVLHGWCWSGSAGFGWWGWVGVGCVVFLFGLAVVLVRVFCVCWGCGWVGPGFLVFWAMDWNAAVVACLCWWVVVVVFGLFLFGEFDPGSGRTLAACLTHASRTVKPSALWGVDEWRTGE